jgi:hypothetical protein
MVVFGTTPFYIPLEAWKLHGHAGQSEGKLHAFCAADGHHGVI